MSSTKIPQGRSLRNLTSCCLCRVRAALVAVVVVVVAVAGVAAIPTMPLEVEAMQNSGLFQGDIKGVAGQNPGVRQGGYSS